jgi:alkylation response protein AidB-like acyl-CoA dehydrogenase
MDFELTDQQKLIRNSARQLMKKEVTPHLDSFPHGHIMTKEEITTALRMLQPLNYIGACLPEDEGGVGLDLLTYAVLMEELDYRIWSTVLITDASTRYVAKYATREQKARLMRRLLSGEMIGCGANTEPDVGSAIPRGVTTKAVLDGDSYVINGTKAWISNGAVADVCMVMATEDSAKGRSAIHYYIVEKDVSPWTARRTSTIGDGPVADVAELVFEDCRIPRENKVAHSGSADVVKQWQIDMQVGRAMVGLASVVIAQKALDLAVQYAKERKQFGKLIGEFQLIQGLIAEMKALTDASRLLVYRGLDMAQKGQRSSAEASVAKMFATEAAVKVTSMAMQIHGANGLATEYRVESLFRHARMLTIPEGTTQIQQLVIGKELLGLSAMD